jgi:NitT/TauT family transport system substrate-binding protein
MSMAKRILAALAIVSALATPGAAAEKATLRLDWSLVSYHLPFYWAHAKGYYAQEGIDLTIGEGAGSGQTVQLMGANQETFGHADATVMANAIAKGMPIRAVAATLPTGVFTYLAHESAGIRSPRDLIGKSVAIIANQKPLHDLFLEKHGIPGDKVTLRITTAQARNALFADKKIDAILTVVIGNALDFVVKDGADKYRFLRFADWGIHTLGYTIMAHHDTLARKPQLVRGFLKATRRGWQEVPANLDEAIRVAITYVPRGEGREAPLRLGFQEAIKMRESPHAKGKPWGWMAPEDWQQTQAVLLATKSIETAIPLDQYYTNAFLSD